MSFADLGGRAGGGVLGNQGERGEDIFQAFDPRIIRRFLAFLKPYPKELWRIFIAVLIFVGSQLSIPILIRYAADSATAAGQGFPFDLVVLAGNVLIFVAHGTEHLAVERCAAHLRPGGLLVAGFQVKPGGYDPGALDADAAAAGLELVERWSTWDRAPFTGGDYQVSVHRRR